MRVDAHAHALQERWFGEPYWEGLSRIGQALLDIPADLIPEGIFTPEEVEVITGGSAAELFGL